MRYSTITAIGGFTEINGGATDHLRLVPSRCTGGADAPLRVNVEDAPGADGALIFPPLDGPQIITLSGDLDIRSTGVEVGYLAAIDTLLGILKSDLDALKASPGSLVHSGGTLSVWKYAPIETSWDGTIMGVTFGLIVDA